MSLLQHSFYSFFAIIFYFSTFIHSYSEPTKIKCRKDMYSRLSILGAINSFIPFTEECYGCLYAIQNNDIFYKSCLGRETELGYRNFSDFIKNGCQREFKCYTCYTDNCNMLANPNEMFPVQSFTSNSFKCYHGEREASQFRLIECPYSTKRCIIMHNFEHRYWATTCEEPISYLGYLFPESKNLTIDYYYCTTNECNYKVENLHNTTQAVSAWMKNEEPSTLKNFNVSLLSSQTMLSTSQSYYSTTFTIIGKALPNATSFRLTILNSYDDMRMKLIFNIKKNFIAFVLPGKIFSYAHEEYRRNLTIDLNKPIEIVFNLTNVFINGKKYFNSTTIYSSLKTIVYSGEWNILAAYKVDKKTGKKETLVKTNYNNFTLPYTNCPVPLSPEKKIFYFPRGEFKNKQTLFISTTTSSRKSTGAIALRLQSTPCGDLGSITDIPLYMILTWETTNVIYEDAFYRTTLSASTRSNITNFSPNLTNNIIYSYPKLTIWSRYGSQWSEGKVYSFISSYYDGPKNLQIQLLNNSLKITDGYYSDIYFKNKDVEIKFSTKIRYLVAVDPFSIITDFVVSRN